MMEEKVIMFLDTGLTVKSLFRAKRAFADTLQFPITLSVV